ncbi:MAG: integrase [Candidatus Bathyarchaeia archaeon]
MKTASDSEFSAISLPPLAESDSEIRNLENMDSNRSYNIEMKQRKGSFESQENRNIYHSEINSEVSEESRYTLSKNGIPHKINAEEEPLIQKINWSNFENWLLRNHRRHTVVSLVNYSKKYAHCLLNRDLTEVRDLRDTLRPNVVRALSNLAKYLGIHEDWKELVKQYGLKWTGKSTDELLIDRLVKVKNPDEVFQWIKQVKNERKDLMIFMDYIAITGLRLEEAVQSYNLIIELSKKGKLSDYYNEENETLEHFKFKEVFIRKSKKAFASFVPKDLIKQISVLEPFKSKHAVQKRVRLANLPLRFADVREMHASFLTKYLKPPEIDFLHGRVSANVFMQNYFNPKLINDLKERVFQGIHEIKSKIS